MAEPTLTPYRDEIAQLSFTWRESQAAIIRHLERVYGVRMNTGTLSRFLKKTLPEAQQPLTPDGPQLSPDEEQLLAKVEVLEGVHTRLEVLEDAAAERRVATGASLSLHAR